MPTIALEAGASFLVFSGSCPVVPVEDWVTSIGDGAPSP